VVRRQFRCEACGFTVVRSDAAWDVLTETGACPKCRVAAPGFGDPSDASTPTGETKRDREWALRTLGVAEGASEESIKQAYLDLAQVWHPDRFEHNERLKKKAAEQFKDVAAAYEFLKFAPNKVNDDPATVTPAATASSPRSNPPAPPEADGNPSPSGTFWLLVCGAVGTGIWAMAGNGPGELGALTLWGSAAVAVFIRVPKTRGWFIGAVALAATVGYGLWQQENRVQQTPASSVAETSRWPRFDSPEGRFSAAFPVEPRSTTTTVSTRAGPVQHHRLTATSNEGTAFDVAFDDLPINFVRNRLSRDLLDDARRGMLAETGALLVTERSFDVENMPAREVVATRDGWTIDARVILVGNRMYTLGVVGRSVKSETERAFFDSFRFGAASKTRTTAPDILSDVLDEGRLPVVRPDGTLTSVRRAKYEEAISAGYRFQTPEEQERFHDQLKRTGEHK
jgi:hypothetical protein